MRFNEVPREGTTRQASAPFAKVVDRYALAREIASGGMATVHLARAIDADGTPVAVKHLHPHLARDPDIAKMFLDEARVASRIHHPNVVPLLDVVTSEGQAFLVLAYVHGESLARLLARAADKHEPVPLPIAVGVIVDALRGLAAAHDATDERGAPLGVVHRDVSPQNVLVGVDGVARVLDFGIAKAVGRLHTTREARLKGKLGYLAPERLDGEATRASDIYAAGVCLWEAITSRRLFAGDNESVVLAKVLAGLVDPPSAQASGVSDELDAIVLRALDRDPAKRFASAGEMANALAACVTPASRAEIGVWVARIAEAALRERAEVLASMALRPRRSRATVVLALSAALVATAAVALGLRAHARPADERVASAMEAPAPAANDSHITVESADRAPAAQAAPMPAAPTTTRVVAPAPRVRRAASPHKAARPDCREPYTIDATGMKHYKKVCLD